jgi:hypothetical protein
MKRKSSAIIAKPPVDRAPYWDFFFRDQRSATLRSMLVASIMAGRPLEMERLPAGALLDVVLLGCACRVVHQAEVVDDWEALLRRTNEEWKNPLWTRKTFDQVHSGTASFIALQGRSEFLNFEESYIPDLAGWILAHEPPEYFARELTK